MDKKIHIRLQKILYEINNMNCNFLYKWKNNIYTNSYLIDNECKECEICSKYLFLIEEDIIKDNFLGIVFLDNHIHFNNKYSYNDISNIDKQIDNRFHELLYKKNNICLKNTLYSKLIKSIKPI